MPPQFLAPSGGETAAERGGTTSRLVQARNSVIPKDKQQILLQWTEKDVIPFQYESSGAAFNGAQILRHLIYEFCDTYRRSPYKLRQACFFIHVWKPNVPGFARH